jgi:hypothetical protein
MKFVLNVDRSAWDSLVGDNQQALNKAAVAALRETAANAVKEGRSNIAGAGRFGPRWQQGLQYRMVKGDEPSAIIFHKIGFAGVFEHGATIQGKPLLWIPTRHGAPPASKSGKKLTFATVGGTPLAFDADDKARDRKPLYIGVPEARIEPKWRIIEIVKEHAAQLAELFFRNFKG